MIKSLKWAMAIAVALGMSVSASALGTGEEKTGKCPVSGEAASANSTADFKGKKVNFCCDECIEKFKKEPEKFTAKANLQLAVTGKIVQVACPFSGNPVNAEAKTDIDGVEVKFCCKNCKAKAEKSDDKVKLVFADISKGFTKQDTCPVSGKKINIDKTTTYNNKTVYFCCEGCAAKFKAEPTKYESKLPKE